MYSLLTIAFLVASVYFTLQLLRLRGMVERTLAGFGLAAAYITAWGYLLSATNKLAETMWWIGLSALSTVLVFIVAALARCTGELSLRDPTRSLALMLHAIQEWYTREATGFEKALLIPLILTTVVTGLLNLSLVVMTAPGNWDSMTYHLARVAYYLQQGNLGSFNADYWAQVVHPKVASILLAFAYLASGRNENLTQAVQFAAYWIGVLSVYAICRRAGAGRSASLFAATVTALLVEWLMEATTTQNDLLIAALVGAACYFLFAFRQEHRAAYLALAALDVTLALGVKESALLALPSLALIALWTMLGPAQSPPPRLGGMARLLASLLVSFVTFTLPAGYVENTLEFGNPMGPQVVSNAVTYAGASPGTVLREGTRNAVRYAYEFISLDGLPPLSFVRDLQWRLRDIPASLVPGLQAYVQAGEATSAPFGLQKAPAAHEDFSYWGVFGFAFVLITLLLSLLGVLGGSDVRLLSIAAVVFFAVQAYVGPYDPWRGRYLMTCAIFAVPSVTSVTKARHALLRVGVGFVVVAGCLSALSAVVLRDDGAIVSVRFGSVTRISVFELNRIQQLTRRNDAVYHATAALERIVPPDATIATLLPPDSFEYPLFGRQLTRRIEPLYSFDRGIQPIPADAQYLLYANGLFACASGKDIALGEIWHLRPLTDDNRTCGALGVRTAKAPVWAASNSTRR